MKTTSQITQEQLRDILSLEEEIKVIRERIQARKAKIAAALLAGAESPYGPHLAVLTDNGAVRIYPWRGAIMRHDDEDVKQPQPRSEPATLQAPQPALLIPARPDTPVA